MHGERILLHVTERGAMRTHLLERRRRLWAGRAFAATICLLVLSFLPQLARGMDSLELGNADTRVVINAGATAPYVLSLAVPGGTVWKGQQPQSMIDKVLIDGKWKPVHWNLVSASREHNGTRIKVVYASSTPHL